MNYFYRFIKSKKIDSNTTRMAMVIVINQKDGEIGHYCFSRDPDEEHMQEMVWEIIREYETGKIWKSTINIPVREEKS